MSVAQGGGGVSVRMSRAALIGQVLKDTYRLERIIGEGGMGVVFEASHVRLQRRFAVKMLAESVAGGEGLARFNREARVTSSLGHPHIVDVLDSDVTPDGSPYLVMELLNGEDLASRLAACGQLEVEQASAIFAQIASALGAAHERSIIHRDLKPRNVFLCQRHESEDWVKVVDFGLSKVLGSQSELTREHSMLGTPGYMAPEQIDERHGPVDQRVDIYALGTILFEMLAGQPPFTGSSPLAVVYKVVELEPPALRSLRPDLPEALDEAILRAMAKRPDDRYASAAELAEAVTRAVELTRVYNRTAAARSVPAEELAKARAAFGASGTPESGAGPTLESLLDDATLEQVAPRADVTGPQRADLPTLPPPSPPSSRQRWRPAVALGLIGGLLLVAGAIVWLARPGSGGLPASTATDPGPAASAARGAARDGAPAAVSPGRGSAPALDAGAASATGDLVPPRSDPPRPRARRWAPRRQSPREKAIVPAATSAPASLRVQVRAHGKLISAEILVDGVRRGRSPFYLAPVPPGRHCVRARVEGFTEKESCASLAAGEKKSMLLDLR